MSIECLSSERNYNRLKMNNKIKRKLNPKLMSKSEDGILTKNNPKFSIFREGNKHLKIHIAVHASTKIDWPEENIMLFRRHTYNYMLYVNQTLFITIYITIYILYK